MKKTNELPIRSDIIFYTTPEGSVKVEVFFRDETVWLTQKLIAQLFDTTKQNISLHLHNIYNEGELSEQAVVKEFLTTAADGKKYKTSFYNLDAIISVGYRVNSQRATQFRIWATQRLREYIIKGFALDDERLKQGGGGARYFEELLQRIRDIRASERNFYQKVTDIYATSIDYRKDDELTQQFFATVQNKIHYAVHGHTAAEIIAARADSRKPLMGLTSFKGSYITEHDITIAKNYLSEEELKQLGLIVSLYFDFAELQASNQKPMWMRDWIRKLDEFLKLSEKGVLENSGKIGTRDARQKAEAEFEKYKRARDKKYVSDFDREVKRLLRIKKKDNDKHT